MFSDKSFRSLNSKTKSSTQVVTRTMKTLSRCASTLLSKESGGSAVRSVSGLRLPIVSSLLSSRWLLCWVLVVSVVVRCQGQDVAEQRNTETEAVDKYLSTFGYYSQEHGGSQNYGLSSSSSSSGVVPGHTAVDRSRALKRLQAFFHLPVSGQVDTGTQKILKAARCGRKDIEGDDAVTDGTLMGALRPASGRRVKRYSVNRYGDGSLAKWNLTQLTWRISRPSRQLSELQQRDIILRSLAMWGEYMPIRFVEDRSQNIPDIDIHFARGKHGPQIDPIFDGKPEQTSNVLAHSWPPGYNIKGLAGDVHFDEDDDWKDYDTLLAVAVHELGHSMGLGHSEDKLAIMYPVYRNVTALAQDDINGITEMYGSSSGTRPRPMTQAPAVWTYKPEPRYFTDRPDIRFRTERPDPRYRTERPDPRYRTERPDPRYRTERPDPRYRTERPDPRYRTERPDPRYRTERPDPRYRTERPDPRYRTERPDPRYRTERPDPRYRTERPDPRYRTERPDPRYRTERPDPRYRTERPDPRYRTERPDQRTRAPFYTLKPVWIEPPTTQSPVDMCSTVNVDAVFEDPTTVIGRKYIAVSDEYVHTLTQHGVLVKSERLQNVYPGVPMNPDVGFSISKKRTVYFIKDNLMWAYKDGKLENDGPRSLRSLQFPEPPKFSVTINQRDGSDRLLLFGARYWWIFDVDRSFFVHYQPISSFSGKLPPGVRFAARWIDNYLYAVTQDSYVIMDLDMRRLTHERPIAGKPEWLQALCGHGSRVSVSVSSLLAVVMFASMVKSFLLW